MSALNSKPSNVFQCSLRNVSFGKEVTVVEPCNLYDCTIGDNIFIGPFVEIQKGVVIKSGSRIQSHTFICELVSIGENCFIGHGVMFTNDLFTDGQPSSSPNNWEETYIGNNVSIGSNTTILPVRIADGVVVGAGSVVTKNLEERGIYAGNLARLIRKI